MVYLSSALSTAAGGAERKAQGGDPTPKAAPSAGGSGGREFSVGGKTGGFIFFLFPGNDFFS